MAKAKSVARFTGYNPASNTLAVTVEHTMCASYSRSVLPAAWKVFAATWKDSGMTLVGGRAKSRMLHDHYTENLEGDYPVVTMVLFTTE